MAERDFRLRRKQPAGGVFDDFPEGVHRLAVAAEQAVAVSGEIVAARAFLGFGGVLRVALEQRGGEHIFALVVMVRRQRVGGGGGPHALGSGSEWC
jgi:hypothetical protein